MSSKHIITKDGLPLGVSDVDSLESADYLRNALYQSGHYGVMSKCMAAGLNSGFDDGVCRIYRIDKTECKCTEFFQEFEEILAKENKIICQRKIMEML